MIADYFPRDKLGRALGVYQSGAFFGVGLAFIFGGLAIQFAKGADDFVLPLVGTLKPWQMAFILVGLPGVLVAAMMFFVLEPVRQGIKSAAENEISLGQTFRFAFQRWRVFITHYTGFALLALPMTTLATWVPTYFIRVVGMPPPEAAPKLGFIVLILSPIGVIGGGWLSDILWCRSAWLQRASRNRPWPWPSWRPLPSGPASRWDSRRPPCSWLRPTGCGRRSARPGCCF
jgi:hypothetical protein